MEATEKRVTIHQIPGALEDARQKAMSVAMETHREQAPVRIFKQGDREMISGVLPVKVMTRILYYNSAVKGETADRALDATNRPVIKDHWVAFASYLKKALEEDQPFIIPPLTLNATGICTFTYQKGRKQLIPATPFCRTKWRYTSRTASTGSSA